MTTVTSAVARSGTPPETSRWTASLARGAVEPRCSTRTLAVVFGGGPSRNGSGRREVQVDARAEHAIDALERPLEIARQRPPRTGRARRLALGTRAPLSIASRHATEPGPGELLVAHGREGPRHVVARHDDADFSLRLRIDLFGASRRSAWSSASTMRLASSSSRLAATGTLHPPRRIRRARGAKRRAMQVEWYRRGAPVATGRLRKVPLRPASGRCYCLFYRRSALSPGCIKPTVPDRSSRSPRSFLRTGNLGRHGGARTPRPAQ